MGVGIHGEPGRSRVKLTKAHDTVEQMVGAIISDYDSSAFGPALLFVNGFGGTPSLELYLVYQEARQILQKRGLAVSRSLVGSYVTSLDMAGCSITVSMLDDRLTALWDAPVNTAALRW
jgi:phosphoenolpyruvate---glycerone phosphotransferase subunit DhaK